MRCASEWIGVDRAYGELEGSIDWAVSRWIDGSVDGSLLRSIQSINRYIDRSNDRRLPLLESELLSVRFPRNTILTEIITRSASSVGASTLRATFQE